MIVFHGSIEIVKSPDVLHSYRSLDFGKGRDDTTIVVIMFQLIPVFMLLQSKNRRYAGRDGKQICLKRELLL